MTVIDLPLELLLFIIEYLDNDGVDDSSLFASANRSVSRVLLKKARKIAIGTECRKWKDSAIRSRLLQMIENPYHQLSFWNDTMDGFDSIFVLEGVYSLCFRDHCASQLSLLMKKVKDKRFILKELAIFTIEGYSYEAIPCLESLSIRESDLARIEELHISAYSSLRSLKLGYCMNLEDVSCLDWIYDLEIEGCPKIRDISTLNNNYRVSIVLCRGITTYSKSFHFSRSVRIYNRSSSQLLLSLENCNSLTSLSINNKYFTFSEDYKYSLRFLQLTAVENIRSLPPNHLQKVDISYCYHFESLENMDNIRCISLTGLQLTTLEGLGPKNQIITLDTLKKLEDISALKEATTVSIKCCSLTLENIISSFVYVQELSIDFKYNQTLNSIPFLKSFKKLEQLKDLKVLKLYISFDVEKDKKDYYDEIKELILMMIENTVKFVLHNVKKFILSGDFFKMFGEEFHEKFLITRRVVKYTEELILLRKISE